MTTVTVEDVLAAAETLSLEDKRILHTKLSILCQEEFNQNVREVAATFKVGDHVSWYHTKHDTKIYGKIVKINPKNILVESYQGKYGIKGPFPVKWTVTPTLLTKETGPGAGAQHTAREVQTLTTKDIGVITFGADGKMEIK